jgi:hypothetical protein
MSKLVHNERTKLTATFWNNFALAAFFGGIVAPVVSAHKAAPVTKADVIIVLGGFLLAVGAHLYARWLLRSLEE